MTVENGGRDRPTEAGRLVQLGARRPWGRPKLGWVAAADHGWAHRLAAVGRTLDARGATIADLAVSFDDERAFASGLEWQAGRFGGVWSRWDATIDAFGGDRGEAPPGSWTPWLRAIGLLLDREPGPLRDVCLLQVEGGVVVDALAAEPAGNGAEWRPRGREWTDDVIADVVAAAGKGRGGLSGSVGRPPWRR